jgi:hypothetical protein
MANVTPGITAGPLGVCQIPAKVPDVLVRNVAVPFTVTGRRLLLKMPPVNGTELLKAHNVAMYV